MYCALDIGGTQIKQAYVTKEGELSDVKTTDTPKTKQQFLACIENILNELPDTCQGVGISCPGKIDTTTKTVYHGGSLTFLDHFSFADFFEKIGCTLPVAVQNDGKAAILGEYWLGSLQGIRQAVGLTLGTGVGGGLLVDGKLLEGKNFQAGEFSFILNHPSLPDKQVMTGAQLSAARFIKQAARLLELEDITDGQTVFEHLNKNSSKSLYDLFEGYCFQIASLLFNLQCIFDPEKIVIGGGISAQSLLIAEINRQYAKILNHDAFYQQTFTPVVIEACQFQNHANCLGAVYALRTELSS